MPVSRTKRGGLPRFALRTAVSLAAFFASQLAWCFEPFVVRDIRVEGAQRTEPGTVFSYLPVKVGELVTEDKAAAAVRALFATGFFKDVRLEVEGDVLVVYVEERPTIASLTITGAKDMDPENLKKSLRDYGFGDGRIFDRGMLERAEQELKRQYLTRGKYAVKVTTTVTPLERNRVGITMNVEEGESARIRAIRIVGNQAFPEKELVSQFKLQTPGMMSWYTKNDQYSREKLTGDLEALRSFYLDRGYLEFSVDSTQVSISPDKEDVFLTVGITEGGVYRVNEVKLAGQLLGRDEELAALITVKPGETFSGRKLTDSQKAISDRLGQLGYAFANINAVPEIDRTKREVSFQVMVDPGRRVYVRRINVTGNVRTRDEIIRREMRQFESAWYDSDMIRLSRERLGRLGYFTDVKVDSSPVPDAPDQVDLTVSVKEQPTGAVTFGIGLSSAEKVILSLGINQQNFLGSGKSVGLNVNTSKLMRTLALSVTDPYFTQDGISRSFDAYYRTYDASVLNLGNYKWITQGIGLRFGIPYTEVDRFSAGVSVEGNSLHIGSTSPQRYKDYVAEFGQDSVAFLGLFTWRRDSRDSAFAPTKGQLQAAGLEFTLPGSDLNYAKVSYNHQWYFPVTRNFTIALNGDIGVGRAYGGEVYPLFKNYYAGGIGSVRGFQQASLGPRDPVDNVPTGGQTRIIGNAEFLFPLAGTGEDRSFRTFFFLDAGNVYVAGPVDLGELRYAGGVGINWASPMGPLKLSWGRPLNHRPGDRTQAFQFQVGSGF
jgi:outer membrane protein insertion porin family